MLGLNINNKIFINKTNILNIFRFHLYTCIFMLKCKFILILILIPYLHLFWYTVLLFFTS